MMVAETFISKVAEVRVEGGWEGVRGWEGREVGGRREGGREEREEGGREDLVVCGLTKY